MRLILKKNIVIPKGTVFENIDGETSHYAYDNYAVIISLDNDTTARIIISSENEEYFKEEAKQDETGKAKDNRK